MARRSWPPLVATLARARATRRKSLVSFRTKGWLPHYQPWRHQSGYQIFGRITILIEHIDYSWSRLFSDPNSDRWKVMNEMAMRCKVCLVLTGNSNNCGPVAAYGFIEQSPHRVPKTRYGVGMDERLVKERKTGYLSGLGRRCLMHFKPVIRFNADDALDHRHADDA